jgi:membrane-associated phospholipid phosphatase
MAASLGVAAATARGRGQALDRRLYLRVNQGAGGGADRGFAAITELGSIWASGGAATVLALAGRRRAAANAFGAAMATWLVGQGAKRAIDRARPYGSLEGIRLLIERPRASSWPSSHPAVLLALVTVAGRELGLGPVPRAALTALAGAVAASRVYVGVHYPADVVGGMLMGRAVAEAWPSTPARVQ